MKKIIRLALAVALAAAAVTGCGKIYDEIDGVRTDLIRFQSGPFKDAQTQIEGLKTQVTNLETAKTAIEAEIERLKKTVDTGHEARITALETSVAQINTTIEGINTTISTIQTNLEKKADKTYVDDAIATVNAHIDAVETAAAAAQTTADAAQDAADAAQDAADAAQDAADAAQDAADAAQEDATKGIADAAEAMAAAVAAQTAADDAQTAADAAQDAADAAQEDIDALEEIVEAMYTNAQIEAKFAALEEKMAEEDLKLKKEIDDIKDSLDTKVAELLVAIQNNATAIAENKLAIAENKAAIEKTQQDLETTNANIEAVKKDLEQLKKDLLVSDEILGLRLAKVEKDLAKYVGDIAARITSVEVVPADSAEIVTTVLGDQKVSTFITSVLISPAEAAATVAEQFKTNSDAVKVVFKDGLTRGTTREVPAVTVASVEEGATGQLIIKGAVNENGAVRTDADTLTYYAVQVSMKDTLATANTVTSDFVRAHQDNVDLASKVTFVWYFSPTSYSTDPAQTGGDANYSEFIKFGKSDFKEKMFIIGTSDKIEPGVRYNETTYNATTFEAATGIKLDFTYDALVYKVGSYDGAIDDWFDTTGTGFNVKLVGLKDSDSLTLKPLYKAPGKLNGVGFKASNFKANGVSMPGFQYTKSFAADFWNHDDVNLGTVEIDWNYLAVSGMGTKYVLVDTSKSKDLKLSWHAGKMETQSTPDYATAQIVYGKNISGKQIDTIKITNAKLGESSSDLIAYQAGFANSWANRYHVKASIKYNEIPAIGKDTVNVTLPEMSLPVNAAEAKVAEIVAQSITQNGGVAAYVKGLEGPEATEAAVKKAFAEAAQSAGAFMDIKINDVAQSQESTVITNQILPTPRLVFKPNVFEVGKSYKIDAYLSAFEGTYHVQFYVKGAPAK